MATISALLPAAFQQVVDANGAPYSGARLYSFTAGGTSTPLSLYSDTGRTTAYGAYVEADSAGRFPEMFMKPQAYYLELKTSAGVTIATADNVVDLGSLVYASLPTAPGLSALTSLLVGLFADPALATPKPVDGTYITTVASTKYTVPAATIALVTRITLFNADTVPNDAQIDILPSGASVTAATAISRATLTPSSTVILDGPWFLEAGDFISMVSASATGTDMSVRIELAEMTAQLTGVTMLFDDGSALTNAYATYMTATARTIVYAMTACNTDTAQRVTSITIVPQGGTSANAQEIFGAGISAKQTVIIGGPFVLETGDFIQAKAASGAVVGFRLSAFQLS